MMFGRLAGTNHFKSKRSVVYLISILFVCVRVCVCVCVCVCAQVSV